MAEEFTFLSSDQKTNIHVRGFLPEGEVKGCLQIAHGVAEHIGRYDEFMQYLAGQGFVVFGNSHLGHGKSVCTEEDRGFFKEEGGWQAVLSDMKTLHESLKKRFPNVKHFLFGHSMGSFLARSYIMKYPKDFDGCIICGTGQQSNFLLQIGLFTAKKAAKKLGVKTHSEQLQKMIFGGYCKRIEHPRTEYDWLSRNEENVDTYLADPYCGGISSIGLFVEMLKGIRFVSDRNNLLKMDKTMPVFIIAGTDDPVGDYGKGPQRVFERFKEAGVKNLSLKLYAKDRHEILNEKDRKTVFEDIIKWLTVEIEKKGRK